MPHLDVSRRSLALSAALLFAVLISLSSAAPIFANGTVTNCSNDTAFTNALSGGGLVDFSCPPQTINLSGTKTISANTTIDGGGDITLSAGHAFRMFQVNSGWTLTLKNIVLTSGYGSTSNGGTIYNAGHLILENVTIRDAGNSNFYGAAVATFGALDVTNSKFINNNAGSGGAIYAIGSFAVVTISGSEFTGNSVASSNPASKRGGAIYIANGATLNLSNSSVYKNTGAYGSGIANDNGFLNLTDVTLAENESTGSGAGGGIHNTGSASLTRVSFLDNFISSGNGGGMFNAGTATLANVWFDLNGANWGGGIANDHGTLSVTNALFTSNHANVAGGGGIASTLGTMTLTNVTFSKNFASGDAGGVENGKGTAILRNVTFAENYASSGGGMWNLFDGVADLTNVTFSENSGLSNAGGIGNSNSPNTKLTLRNVIVANSKAGTNCVFQKAPIVSSSNLASDGSCSFGAGRDNVTVKLGKLGTEGGARVGREQLPMLTYRILKGSAPIDKGEAVLPLVTDQRGVTRPRGTSNDVGAVEYVPCTGAPTKPELIAPVHKGKVFTPTALLDWVGPDCAKKFHVVVRKKGPNGPIVFAKRNIKATEMETTALQVYKKYVWQVTACVGIKCTASDWFKFRTEN